MKNKILKSLLIASVFVSADMLLLSKNIANAQTTAPESVDKWGLTDRDWSFAGETDLLTKVNASTRFAEFLNAANSSDDKAMVLTGWALKNAIGIDKNDEEAVRWYREGSNAGNSRAMAELGWMYYSGKGVPESKSEAMRWFRSAANAGNAEGMRNLAFHLFFVEGISDATKRPKVLCGIAQLLMGVTPGSMVNLAQILKNGQEIPRDEKESSRWYLAAAEAGNPLGMHGIGKATRIRYRSF